MSRIIGLAGYAQSGKDTVVGMLGELGYQRASFAEVLRSCMLALNPIVEYDPVWNEYIRYADLIRRDGYEGAKRRSEVRALLQRLGTDAGRNILGDNVWVDAAMRQIEDGGLYAFSDVRFPNEAGAVRALGGEVWRVVRPGTEPVNAHPSETALDGYYFDRIIQNTGTLGELRFSVLFAVEALVRRR